MTNSEHAWPRLLRRLSLSGSNRRDRTRDAAHNPPLPTRPSHHLYQPADVSPEPSRPNTSADGGDIDDITFLIQEQQRLFDQVEETRRSSTFASMPEASGDSGGSGVETKPPTSDRIAEFRLDIPDGVRNMTQHPGNQIVGSVVVTVTRSTKAQRISLHFLGYQKVYLKDPSSQSPIAPSVGSEYKLFDKKLVVWGDKGSVGSAGVLDPGTLTIPFSIRLPFVNYPSSLRRESVCKVKYMLWAELDRPGTFKDHVTRTHREEIYMEPLAYPTRPCDTNVFQLAIPPRSDRSSSMAGVAVGLEGSIWPIPVVAGDCINYRISAHAVSQNPSAPTTDASKYIVKQARAVVVERLDVRGLIKGVEYAQSYRLDVFTMALAYDNDKVGSQSSNDDGIGFISSGQMRLPLDLCPFEGKQLSRRYELRIEFDLVDSRSLLDKVIRHSSPYAHWIPLDICTVSPDDFQPETLQNAFADESLNINSIAPPSYSADPSEPELEIGGWELAYATQSSGGFDRPAVKDSTIFRSTVSCPDCPDRNCYKCTLGHDSKLKANTGGLAYISALVGFEMPTDGSNVESCTVQIPAFSTRLQSPITVVVSNAASSDWPEDTVNGENAPALGDEIASVDVPAYNNLPAVDITPACQAAVDGKFSIYFNARFGSFEFWSKDSGNPAILHVVTK
ncbi:hypothetical protein LPJ56_000345 [Coemansia sp. RSA 2599]|nr:hypothetical protein LPJ75_000141 [Coemansia sp. RSA 2598]KAJ1829403.1 hypothetical protein LPJ56_000345 [Coemansia sp. RSA 2599]